MADQIDITTLELTDLYRHAFEQQKVLTGLVAQIQQVQNNIAAIEAEIKKREDRAGSTTPPKK